MVATRSAAAWRALPLQEFHFSAAPLGLSWLVQSAGWLLAVANWRLILGEVGAGGDVGYRGHLRAHTWSALGNLVPGSVWLPAGRVALYRRLGVSGVAVSAAIVVEWLVTGIAALALYVATLPFGITPPWAALVALAATAGAGVVVLDPRVRRAGLGWAARRLGREPGALDHLAAGLGRRAVVLLVVRQAAVLAVSGVGLYFFMVAVAPKARLSDALGAWALSVAVANLLAWLPATILFREGALALALFPLYASGMVAVGVAVAWRLWMSVVLASWSVLAFATRGGDAGRGSVPLSDDCGPRRGPA